MPQRKTYSESFKKKVVDAVEAGLTGVEASKKFHVAQPNISNWKRRYAAAAVAAANPLAALAESATLKALARVVGALQPLQAPEREAVLMFAGRLTQRR